MNDERIHEALRDATDTQNVTIATGALASVDDIFAQSFGDRAAVVVADEQTFAVAGEEAQKNLEAAGEAHEAYKFYVDRYIETYPAMKELMHKTVRHERSSDTPATEVV